MTINEITDTTIFGYVDNILLIFFAYKSALSIEKYLQVKFNTTDTKLVCATVGAFSNTISDGFGWLVTLNIEMMFYTMLGCIIAMAFIPIFEKYVK